MTDKGKRLAGFIWDVADQLRGIYRPSQYSSVALPLVILHRLDCVLESTKAEVLVAAEKISNPDQLDLVVRKKFGLRSTTVDAPAWPQRLVAAFSRV